MDKRNYGWTNFSFLDLYFSEPEYAESFWGAMKKPVLMPGNFNQLYHDGPVSFSNDFKQVFTTRTTTSNARVDAQKIKTYLLKIYFANIDEKGNIGQYEPFPYNSETFSLAHPTLSRNNQQLIFSSDMSGGYGGSDLYESNFVNGSWTKPVNLGDKINTAGNEVFPYWANDSVLFFSSTEHLGFGGLDIFKSVFVGGEWSEPENLKRPINSSYDDFGIVLNEKLDGGFFSSNRPEGKGSDDIYAFRNLKAGLSKAAIPISENKLTVSGVVKEKESGSPLSDATIFILESESGQVLVLKTDSNGNYKTTLEYDKPYVAKAMKDGFFHDCELFRTPSDKGTYTFDIPQDLLLLKIEVNHVFTVQNIYYNLGKWDIREDAYPELDNLVQMMKQYPIKAELSSYTDSRGSGESNMQLSQKRAESAVDYMVQHGIDRQRIIAKGYGETRLINQCSDGVPCTEEQHQENRRTEFKILGIDERLIDENQFNLKVFKNGDIINVNMLDTGFFNNCMKNPSLKE